MNFRLTFYIYPLYEKVALSQYLNCFLDNPRTQEEIAAITDYIVSAYDSGYNISLPPYSDEPIITLEDILFRFRDQLSPNDEYVGKFFQTYDRENIFEFIASMWVIARFDDKGEIERLSAMHRQMREEGHLTFSLLDDDHPIIANSEKLVSYSYLLSLLAHSEGEDFYGRSFIIDPQQLGYAPPIEHLWMDFMMLDLANDYPDQSRSDGKRWIFLPYALSDLLQAAKKLDKAFIEGAEEKLLYIGSILKVAGHDVQDVKFRLVMLTSIIELLLTHNPDFSRFNVEDSISKQFQLKASVLIYLNDKTRNIADIRSKLKTIYQQRSNIAHGNFGDVARYIRKLSKKEGEEEYFDDLVADLYSYSRAVLEEYLKDKQFVDFLKEG